MNNETNTRKSAERTQIAEGIFKASETSYYIDVNGVMKYCVKARLDKLLERAGGDYQKVREQYRTRSVRKNDTAQVG